MAQTVLLPKLGQTEEESTIVKWHKKVGDVVAKGDILFEIETDKAVLEVESFFDGTLLKIIVPEGQTVPVTSPVAFIGAPGEPLPELQQPKPAPGKAKPEQPRQAAARPETRAVVKPVELPAAPAPALLPSIQPPRSRVSPRARRLAREAAISLEPVSGTGPEGRITERDVRVYLDASNYAGIRITPAAKNLAVQEGIDILSVRPESESGRLELEDIRRAVAEKPREMSRVRQVIAQRLAQSMVAAPHFYVTVSIDMQCIQDLRKELKQRKINIGLTDCLVKAAALALRGFPALNSNTDGRRVWWKSAVNIGLAVDAKESLLVPVIHDADRLSMTDLHNRVVELVAKAREGRLSPDEMTGGTFTISNMGMLSVENFTAIINPGESAILAVSSTMDKPVVRKGQIVIRPMMKVTLSSDHRLVDGALAARFVNRIKDLMEDADLWKSLTLS